MIYLNNVDTQKYKEMFLKSEMRRLELELEIAGASKEHIQQFKKIIETNIEHKNINKRDPDVEENFIKINGASDEDIKKYIKTGFENSNEIDGKIIFSGYTKIHKESGLTLKKCRTINAVFSENKITEIILTKMGKRSIINYTQKQLLGDD